MGQKGVACCRRLRQFARDGSFLRSHRHRESFSCLARITAVTLGHVRFVRHSFCKSGRGLPEASVAARPTQAPLQPLSRSKKSKSVTSSGPRPSMIHRPRPCSKKWWPSTGKRPTTSSSSRLSANRDQRRPWPVGPDRGHRRASVLRGVAPPGAVSGVPPGDGSCRRRRRWSVRSACRHCGGDR